MQRRSDPLPADSAWGRGYTLAVRWLPLLLTLTGCDAFEFHPYELPSQRASNERAIEAIHARDRGGPFRFAVIGDPQFYLDDTADGVAHIRHQDVEFVILVGDLTQFGSRQEFQWVDGLLDDTGVPYAAVVGNHDVLGTGAKIFTRLYGPMNELFTFGESRFLLFDSNSREYAFPGDVPDLRWLDEHLEPAPGIRHTFTFSHVPPDDADFDPALREGFESLLARKGVSLSFHGHQHRFRDYSLQGIRYLVADTMGNRNYLIVTVDGDQVSVERVFF